MKRILVSLIAGAALIGTCLAQSVQSQASGSAAQQTYASADKSGAQPASASQVQAGSTVQAELVKPLDAQKNKVGDEVVAKTTHDVKSGGHVIVPKGSKLIGHVTEVKAHRKDQATSELGIAFDHAVLKNGTEMPLTLGIQAIGRSQASAAGIEDDSMTGASAGGMGSSSAKTSGGCGGGMLGGVRSPAGGVVNTAGTTTGTAVIRIIVFDQPRCRGAARTELVVRHVERDPCFRRKLKRRQCSSGQRDGDGAASKSVGLGDVDFKGQRFGAALFAFST